MRSTPTQILPRAYSLSGPWVLMRISMHQEDGLDDDGDRFRSNRRQSGSVLSKYRCPVFEASEVSGFMN
jgi:hypothetical protein